MTETDPASPRKPISDPVAAKIPHKNYPWYIEDIDHRITSEVVRTVLESYSNIRSEDVREHVYGIREKAWSIRPYPCTGLGYFLSPSISKHCSYPKLLDKLKSGATLLDIGCYMGRDLRQLVRDGIPEAQLYGNDIVNHYNLGYELFNDKDRFGVSYIESDLLFPNKELAKLHGKIDIIHIVHVLHQWDWNTQVLACNELVKFTRSGSVVVGYQGGTSDMGKRTRLNRESSQNEFTLHDAESFRRMWDVVGEQTETQWTTEAQIVPWSELSCLEKEVSYLGKDFALLRFLVTRDK